MQPNAHAFGPPATRIAALQSWRPSVYSLIDCVAAAVAVYVSNLTVAFGNLNAQYLCNLFSRGSAAYGAAVYRSLALDDSSSQTVTAREAAAAAVCARQALTYQRDALVNLYGENLSGYAEQDREHDTHDKEYRNRVNNILHIHFLCPPLPNRQAGEAHEGHSQQSSRNQRNREAFKALRALGSSVQTLADGSEQNDSQRVADTGCNARIPESR